MPITFYESMGDFARSLPDGATSSTSNSGDKWSGCMTLAAAKKALWGGDKAALEASEKLLEQVEGEGLELAAAQWEHEVAGAFPCIPSYLAGDPENMLDLEDIQSDTSPVKIFVDVCLSGGFSERELAKRGATILALARKLGNIRPIEVWLFASMHGHDARDGYGSCAIPVIKLDTSPMDLTTASFAMGHAAFLRKLCFAWADERGFSGAWAWRGSPSSNRAKIREYLGVGENDMLIDGAYLSDALMSDPVKWVNDQVRKYASVLEEIE